MDTIILGLQQIIYSIKHNFIFLMTILAVLWGIQVINQLFKNRLNILGVYPRTAYGFIGIIFSPFLHGSFNHLLFNTIPFFILANFVLINGRPEFYYASIFIILMAGLLIWLFARKGFHVGASTVIMGYLGFLLFNAYQQVTFTAILLAFVCVYYLGGLFLNLFPTEARTSWEGHVFGFVAGITASYFIPLFFKAL